MPQFMLLLYSTEADEAETAARWADMPIWEAVTDSFREAGILVANDPLHGPDIATTVRVREEQIDLTDGPFAVTKEILAGYYILECQDLDEAVRHAARLPIARYGCVEVRPIMDRRALRGAAEQA